MVAKAEINKRMNIRLNPKYSEFDCSIAINNLGDMEMINGVKIITLCGSTKFKDDFIRAAEELSLAGNIVISLGLFGHADHKYSTVITDEVKEMLDRNHKNKILLSDAIYVINKNGYIGNSTKSEIEFAKQHGKEILYME